MFLRTLALVFMFIVRLRFPNRLSLLQVIRNRYGGTAVKLVRKFEKVDFKYCKAGLDLNFLQTCRRFNVIPKLLQFRVANKSLQRSQAYQKCLNHLLLAAINNINELSSVKSNLLRTLNFLDFTHVCNIIISNNEKSNLKCRYTHKKKLKDFIPGYEVNPARFSHDPNKVIFNFSSYAVTEFEKSLPCKGLRFSIPPKKIEYADFLTQFELLYRDAIMFEMKSENREFLKNKLKDICFSTLKSYSFQKHLSEAESTVLKNLIDRKDLVIQKVDKGNTVVITDRTKYLERIKCLLSDSSKFMPLPIGEGIWLNYIINLENKLKDRFKVLKHEEKISEKEFCNMCPVGTTPNILYGNPKVHKTVVNNTPKFRPILSAINTPTYLLAKYLNPILSTLTTNELTAKNSLDFAEVVN